MIPRRIAPRLDESLDQFPIVALLGSRQVGKSTLAPAFVRKNRDGKVIADSDLFANLLGQPL